MEYVPKVLVIGGAADAQAAIEATRRTGCDPARCAEADFCNNPDSLQGTQFDWVMIDTGLLQGDGADLVRSLRAMGFFSSGGESRCGVEWSRDGTLQLKCCMHAPAKAARPAPRPDSVRPQPGFIFEYHAPMKRTG